MVRQASRDQSMNRKSRRWLLCYVGMGLLGAALLYGLAYVLHRWFGI
jgi:hypothetical protein